MRKVLIVVVLVAAALGLLFWQQHRSGPFFVSGLIEADEIRVGSRLGGRVLEVIVSEGQVVNAGDVLVRLDPYDLHERLAETRATLAAAKVQLDKLKAGFRVEEVAQARARRDRFKAMLDELVAGARPLDFQIQQDKVMVAEAEVTRAQAEYDRVMGLTERAVSESDDAVRGLAVAKAKLEQARHELALMKEGTRAEQIAQAQANLAESEAAFSMAEKGNRAEDITYAEAQLQASEAAMSVIERQMKELVVTAPVKSVVEALELRPGDLIAANAPILSLLDTARLRVRAYVPENRLDLQVGQKVPIRVDAFANRRFSAHISYVSRAGEFTPSNIQTPEERSKQVFRVRVELDEGQDVLRAGMFADVFLEPEK